jgi:hypothetical protein
MSRALDAVAEDKRGKLYGSKQAPGAQRTGRAQMLRRDGPDTLRRDGPTEPVRVDREFPVGCLRHGGSPLNHIAGLPSSESCSGKGRRAHGETDRADNRPGRVHAMCGADRGARERRCKNSQPPCPRGERLHLPGACLGAYGSPRSCRPDPGSASERYCARAARPAKCNVEAQLNGAPLAATGVPPTHPAGSLALRVRPLLVGLAAYGPRTGPRHRGGRRCGPGGEASSSDSL